MATPKVLILCIDGCGPEYLEAGDTPNLTRLGREGFLTEGRAVIPSVTNVNTTSIATGTFPDRHGITTNYCVDRESGAGSFIEDDRFLLEPTLFQKAKATGVASKAALLVTKGKLLGLLGGGADVRIAAEDPTSDYVDAIGPAEEIYSAEVNLWLLRALRRVLRDEDPDLTCCFTTDWVQHKHGPNDDVSLRHMAEMDRLIGAIVDDDPGRQIYVTADHGMGSKTRGLDPERWLREGGVDAVAIPIIKDRYVVHHGNQGGAAYVFLKDRRDLAEALALLSAAPGVEKVYPSAEAATTFRLHPDRIGDLFMLADRETVFGPLPNAQEALSLRSHGSRHEGRVPIIGFNSPWGPNDFDYNLDVGRLGLGLFDGHENARAAE